MRRIYAYSFQLAKPFYNLYNAYVNKITQTNDKYDRTRHMVSVGNPYHSIKLVNSSREIFLRENPQLRNKHIISISPGGYKGFYIMGICKYVKQNYKLLNPPHRWIFFSYIYSYEGLEKICRYFGINKRFRTGLF